VNNSTTFLQPSLNLRFSEAKSLNQARVLDTQAARAWPQSSPAKFGATETDTLSASRFGTTNKPFWARYRIGDPDAGTSFVSTTSSLTTKNFFRFAEPNAVVSATSAASRPVAISTRPILG
jgi:hypothetical protein